MPGIETGSEAIERSNALFQAHQQAVWRQTDQLFALLLLLQWVGAVVCAVWVSPWAWEGLSQQTHPHVWIAVLLGGGIVSLPVFLALLRPGATATRHVVAVGQMLLGALLIHLSGGRIETHFHVFGSLAFLSFYRDWRVLITGSLVVALDHLLRGLFWPQSVFGIDEPDGLRWLEHTGWVVFENLFLLIACFRGTAEMRGIAVRQASLETMHAQVEAKVQQRTQELRRAEAEARHAAADVTAVIENSNDAIWSVDRELRVVTFNTYFRDAFIRAFGVTIAPGRSMLDRLPKAVRECWEGWYARALAGERLTAEYSQFHDGKHRTYEVSLNPILAGGSVTGVSVLSREITERERQREELQKAKDAAEAANQAKSQFLTNMSHEIRTPMNGVLGMAELVLASELTLEQREFMDVLRSSAQSLVAVIDDIMDIAKLESGKIGLRSVEFGLREVVDQAIAPLRAKARQSGLSLTVDVAAEVPERVVGDPARVRQVLLNLAGNGVKFTQQGGVTIRVTLEQREAERGFLCFAVTDTGIGIAAEKLAEIFRPFEQADGSVTRQYGGTGLGLSIALHLAERMGGAICVDSEVGRGSVFRFTAWLGLATPSVAIASQPERKEAVGGEKLRILLAEDNPINRMFAVRTLERCGHQVTPVEDGRGAVDALGKEKFDLVLMDVQMPEMDGLTATRLIRERERETGMRTWIVALTAHAMAGDRELCLAAGMDDYLSKPLNAGTLLRFIEDKMGATASARAGV